MNANNIGGTNSLDFTNCPDWGVGGTYTADPSTGVRTRVLAGSDSASAEVIDNPAPTDAVVDQTETQSVKSVKDKKNG